MKSREFSICSSISRSLSVHQSFRSDDHEYAISLMLMSANPAMLEVRTVTLSRHGFVEDNKCAMWRNDEVLFLEISSPE